METGIRVGFPHHCKELVKREKTSGLGAAPGRALGGGETPEKVASLPGRGGWFPKFPCDTETTESYLTKDQPWTWTLRTTA